MNGMRRLVVLLAHAVAGGLPAVPPAGAEPGTFVLTGTRSGWVDVTVPGEMELTLHDATIETSGRFGGFYAQQISATLGREYRGRTAGLLALRDVMATGELSRPEFLALSRMSPGVIRFYLIADGPTTVTFHPSQGLPERTVRPVRRTAAAVALTPLRRSGETWYASVPLRLPKRAIAAVALRADGERTRLAEPMFCVARRREECQAGDVPLGGLDGRPADRAAAGASYWLVAYSPVALAGAFARDARWSLAPGPAALVQRAVGVRFVLTLA